MATVNESLKNILSTEGAMCRAGGLEQRHDAGLRPAPVSISSWRRPVTRKWMRSKLKTMKSLGLADNIEDILITLGKQYHIIRPVQAKAGIFIYLVLDKARANLALARRACQETEASLSF